MFSLKDMYKQDFEELKKIHQNKKYHQLEENTSLDFEKIDLSTLEKIIENDKEIYRLIITESKKIDDSNQLVEIYNKILNLI